MNRFVIRHSHRIATYHAMNMPAPRSLHDLTFADLERAIAADGVAPAHARTLWRALHREAALDFGERVDFLPPLRRWVDEGYRTLPFPFNEVAPPPIELTAEWTLREFLGYLDTWSSVGQFTKARRAVYAARSWKTE